MSACKLCSKNASDGLHLSNGEIIHESCLTKIQSNVDDINHKLLLEKRSIDDFKWELEKRNGIGFKLMSVFSKPSLTVDQINKMMVLSEKVINRLSHKTVSLHKKLTPIYDYYLTYPPDWLDRRNQVIKRDGEECSQCGYGYHLHLHHIKPLSKGGNNKITNLKFLCESCHSKEHGGRSFSDEFSESETAYSKRVANIRYAIENGKKIKFGYKKYSEKSHKQRVVIPTELVNMEHRRNSGATLCVTGYCELRKAERVFALKRMRGLKVL